MRLAPVRWLQRFTVAAALVAGIGVALTQPAFAHAVNFVIWGYGFEITTGTDDHYHSNPVCYPNCAYDYMMPTYSVVFQNYQGQGNFQWHQMNMPAGNVFGPGTAYRGQNTWFYDNTGAATYVGNFSCVSITNGVYIGGLWWSNGPQSYWLQDSGYSVGTSCYGSYSVTDRMAGQAGQ